MKLMPDRSEILRYLGYRGQKTDSSTMVLLDHCIEVMTHSVKPRFCYKVFTLQQGESVFLPECSLHLPGESIKAHLEGCDQCILLAATLGIEADNLIRISETESMTRAVIFDACATELTEKLCDEAEKEILAAFSEGLHLTSRFSPGYGDLPLDLQHPISEILDTPRRLGLTVTEHSLMLPRKSVTAILGVSRTPCQNTTHNCTSCSLRAQCRFRKEDSHHES